MLGIGCNMNADTTNRLAGGAAGLVIFGFVFFCFRVLLGQRPAFDTSGIILLSTGCIGLAGLLALWISARKRRGG
jgi:hypothetical protein